MALGAKPVIAFIKPFVLFFIIISFAFSSHNALAKDFDVYNVSFSSKAVGGAILADGRTFR